MSYNIIRAQRGLSPTRIDWAQAADGSRSASAVDRGHRPAVAVVVRRCARCGAPLSASDDWATIHAALHAHRVGCPEPVGLPPAADA